MDLKPASNPENKIASKPTENKKVDTDYTPLTAAKEIQQSMYSLISTMFDLSKG